MEFIYKEATIMSINETKTSKATKRNWKKIFLISFISISIVILVFILGLRWFVQSVVNHLPPAVSLVDSRHHAYLVNDEVIERIHDSLKHFDFELCRPEERECPQITVDPGPLSQGIAVIYDAEVFLVSAEDVKVVLVTNMWLDGTGYIRFNNSNDRGSVNYHIISAFRQQYGIEVDKVFFTMGRDASNEAERNEQLEIISQDIEQQIQDFIDELQDE